MKYPALVLFLLFQLMMVHAQTAATRPKIGLTLSGGGAKGLAHIGILKAIDSAGLKIDYITGTSMGAIIGALYAVGYSADSIQKMSAEIDWDLLLSNQSSLRTMIMTEKEEYGKYTIELPWKGNRFQLPSGVLEGQELWLKLAELFAPVAQVKDFTKFNIPFKCVSTDIGSGEAVVMSSGEIVTAIRASMAIPSVFTSIEYQGRRLVDGGIVRNFPVRDVKQMGADIIIGSNVAMDLFPSNKVMNALQILLQVAFFREAEDRKVEVPLCNIYVPMPLEKYTMGSFNDAPQILKLGMEEGRRLYPVFKRLADSLDRIYGKRQLPVNRLPKQDAATISAYEIRGLDHTTPDFFVHTMDFLTNKSYTTEALSQMVRKAYGTRYYSRVVYSLVPLSDSTKKIVFDVTENPLTFAKLGLHYNEFSGISIIANLTSRNFILPDSRDLVTVNIGQNMRLRGEHLQYLGRLKSVALLLGTRFDHSGITTYKDYKQDGVYNQDYFNTDGRIQFSTRRLVTIGLGTRFEWVQYNPSINSSLDLTGKNNFITSYVFLNHNSLDRSIYPKKGVKLEAEIGHVFNQDPHVVFSIDGQPVQNPDSAGVGYTNYQRFMLNIDSYTPLTNRTVFMLHAQSGINFRYRQSIMNDFSIGGLTSLFRNQVNFAGFSEGTFSSASVAVLQAGLRYQLSNSIYLIGRTNALVDNFISRTKLFKDPDFLSGYALTFAYNFPLGPLELSVMYSDQSKKVGTYINIGFPF